MVTEAGSYLRLIDSCITQLQAQGPSRTCNKSKEGEEVDEGSGRTTMATNLFDTLTTFEARFWRFFR